VASQSSKPCILKKNVLLFLYKCVLLIAVPSVCARVQAHSVPLKKSSRDFLPCEIEAKHTKTAFGLAFPPCVCVFNAEAEPKDRHAIAAFSNAAAFRRANLAATWYLLFQRWGRANLQQFTCLPSVKTAYRLFFFLHPVLAPSSLFCIYFCRWSLPGILRINNMSGSQGYYRFFTSIHSFTAG
jgi:hypothetical protein